MIINIEMDTVSEDWNFIINCEKVYRGSANRLLLLRNQVKSYINK